MIYDALNAKLNLCIEDFKNRFVYYLANPESLYEELRVIQFETFCDNPARCFFLPVDLDLLERVRHFYASFV